METNADMEADTDVDANADVEVAMKDPRAWRVAIALALALPEPPDWARWSSGKTAAIPDTPGPDCDECGGWGGYRDTLADECSDQWYTCSRGCESPKQRARKPVPAPWDAAAYLADCARRGVEPGPLPSLEWGDLDDERRPDDGTVSWSVVYDGGCWCYIRVGRASAWVRIWASGPLKGQARIDITSGLGGIPFDDLATLSRLATAAAKAMGT